MSGSVIFEEQVEVPLDLRSLAEFRRWALTDSFPERGRIDYINGRVEVDMSPEEVYCHGTLKSEIHGVLWNRVKSKRLGDIFVDSTRISSVDANLSAEPDIVFVSHESLDEGRVKLVPKASGEPGRYVELEGGPDLVVEIVSDSSVMKDTQRLPVAYFAAGVREFWLADARGDELLFRIHHRGKTEFVPIDVDANGFQHSEVMSSNYQLTRTWNQRGRWEFDLLDSPS
jgi:Uma2 family endonuclease